MTTINQMYTDLDLSISRAWNNDVKKNVGIKAVKDSILLIVTTRKGSRPFDPLFGCDLNKALFENMNPLTVDTLAKNINEAIRNYEPRVKQLNVDVTPQYDENAIIVAIYFSVIDNPDDLEQLKIRLAG